VTARTFEQRLYEHRADTRKESSRIKTCLSSHIWDLKDQNIQYEVTWKLKERGTAFNPTTKKCRICLKEKFHIMYTNIRTKLLRETVPVISFLCCLEAP
jgi:hypothetical protein